LANLGYIQVTRKCNQHCLFCSNPELEATLTPGQARIRLAKLRDGGYTGVILTGGEPTLHPDLADLVKAGTEVGLAVRIITNGQRPDLLESLKKAGLGHVHVSVHSARPDVQAELTSNPDSWKNLATTFDRLKALKITCDVNTVMCARNADHLDETVRVIVDRWPNVRHFVWNNIDSRMNRVAENPHTVARLADLELSLFRAVRLLQVTGRTFRIERLPLCYMADFAHFSTETRKIAKGEERTVHFLDEKGEIRQTEFFHDKTDTCSHCKLDPICAGLYDAGGAYDPAELHALFLDPEKIIARIRRESGG
jgi:MoaA/NifB/PqqE/SkfB family radical SAM enzyme